ncbi:hypothetical protein HII31_10180 [Pseudocercospora fuligena]|uniref:Uncharacterized protein n=1 Tax=Pseudocercospora fuligena TaxID=685502 RepID=A0A8H6VDP1_9PEZI|nr:hypothetical protein HII31_10180 [Pseudocercospora fuligena]
MGLIQSKILPHHQATEACEADSALPSNMPTPTSSTGSPLLNIAAELRNQIYDHVFDDIESISITDPEPGLTRACRQLREETLLIWHSKHQKVKAIVKHDGTQGAHADTKPLVDYITTAPPSILQAIKTIEITWIMSRNDERSSQCRGKSWRPVRDAFKKAGIKSDQISWRIQGQEYFNGGKKLASVQSKYFLRIPGLAKRMGKFLDGDGEHDEPKWPFMVQLYVDGYYRTVWGEIEMDEYYLGLHRRRDG